MLLLLLLAVPFLVTFTCRRLAARSAAIAPPVRLPPVRLVRRHPAATPLETAAPQGLDPFAVQGVAVTGDGAASVARGLIMTALTHWPAGAGEIVMSRADAWELLGVDTGDLVEERIPGLVLTHDFPQAEAYLRAPGPRRLLISCSDRLDPLRDLLTWERRRVAAVTLSPRHRDQIEVTADGRISWTSDPDLVNVVAEPLPVLTRPQAYEQLMSLPTVRKPARAANGFPGEP